MDLKTYQALGRAVTWAEDRLDAGCEERYIIDNLLGQLKRLRREAEGVGARRAPATSGDDA